MTTVHGKQIEYITSSFDQQSFIVTRVEQKLANNTAKLERQRNLTLMDLKKLESNITDMMQQQNTKLIASMGQETSQLNMTLTTLQQDIINNKLQQQTAIAEQQAMNRQLHQLQNISAISEKRIANMTTVHGKQIEYITSSFDQQSFIVTRVEQKLANNTAKLERQRNLTLMDLKKLESNITDMMQQQNTKLIASMGQETSQLNMTLTTLQQDIINNKLQQQTAIAEQQAMNRQLHQLQNISAISEKRIANMTTVHGKQIEYITSSFDQQSFIVTRVEQKLANNTAKLERQRNLTLMDLKKLESNITDMMQQQNTKLIATMGQETSQLNMTLTTLQQDIINNKLQQQTAIAEQQAMNRQLHQLQNISAISEKRIANMTTVHGKQIEYITSSFDQQSFIVTRVEQKLANNTAKLERQRNLTLMDLKKLESNITDMMQQQNTKLIATMGQETSQLNMTLTTLQQDIINNKLQQQTAIAEQQAMNRQLHQLQNISAISEKRIANMTTVHGKQIEYITSSFDQQSFIVTRVEQKLANNTAKLERQRNLTLMDLKKLESNITDMMQQQNTKLIASMGQETSQLNMTLTTLQQDIINNKLQQQTAIAEQQAMNRQLHQLQNISAISEKRIANMTTVHGKQIEYITSSFDQQSFIVTRVEQKLANNTAKLERQRNLTLMDLKKLESNITDMMQQQNTKLIATMGQETSQLNMTLTTLQQDIINNKLQQQTAIAEQQAMNRQLHQLQNISAISEKRIANMTTVHGKQIEYITSSFDQQSFIVTRVEQKLANNTAKLERQRNLTLMDLKKLESNITDMMQQQNTKLIATMGQETSQLNMTLTTLQQDIINNKLQQQTAIAEQQAMNRQLHQLQNISAISEKRIANMTTVHGKQIEYITSSFDQQSFIVTRVEQKLANNTAKLERQRNLTLMDLKKLESNITDMMQQQNTKLIATMGQETSQLNMTLTTLQQDIINNKLQQQTAIAEQQAMNRQLHQLQNISAISEKRIANMTTVHGKQIEYITSSFDQQSFIVTRVEQKLANNTAKLERQRNLTLMDLKKLESNITDMMQQQNTKLIASMGQETSQLNMTLTTLQQDIINNKLQQQTAIAEQQAMNRQLHQLQNISAISEKRIANMTTVHGKQIEYITSSFDQQSFIVTRVEQKLANNTAKLERQRNLTLMDLKKLESNITDMMQQQNTKLIASMGQETSQLNMTLTTLQQDIINNKLQQQTAIAEQQAMNRQLHQLQNISAISEKRIANMTTVHGKQIEYITSLFDQQSFIVTRVEQKLANNTAKLERQRNLTLMDLKKLESNITDMMQQQNTKLIATMGQETSQLNMTLTTLQQDIINNKLQQQTAIAEQQAMNHQLHQLQNISAISEKRIANMTTVHGKQIEYITSSFDQQSFIVTRVEQKLANNTAKLERQRNLTLMDLKKLESNITDMMQQQNTKLIASMGQETSQLNMTLTTLQQDIINNKLQQQTAIAEQQAMNRQLHQLQNISAISEKRIANMTTVHGKQIEYITSLFDQQSFIVTRVEQKLANNTAKLERQRNLTLMDLKKLESNITDMMQQQNTKLIASMGQETSQLNMTLTTLQQDIINNKLQQQTAIAEQQAMNRQLHQLQNISAISEKRIANMTTVHGKQIEYITSSFDQQSFIVTRVEQKLANNTAKLERQRNLTLMDLKKLESNITDMMQQQNTKLIATMEQETNKLSTIISTLNQSISDVEEKQQTANEEQQTTNYQLQELRNYINLLFGIHPGKIFLRYGEGLTKVYSFCRGQSHNVLSCKWHKIHE